MKKITLILMSLCLALGAVAQVDESKYYRIKCQMGYLNASNYDEHKTGPIGGVNVVSWSESSEDQIFTFETFGNGYKLKTKSGKYVWCQDWNVDALDSGSSLTFIGTDDENSYRIYCIKGYFKVESVNNGYYVFCNASQNQAAIWTLEEVNDGGTVEPEPTNPMDYYNTLSKPTFGEKSDEKNTSVIAAIKFGTTSLTGYTYRKGSTTCLNQVLDVEAGKTYSLSLTYELAWGDLAIFQIDSKGSQRKIYGYYDCVWVPNGSPIEELKGSSETFMCEELNVHSFDDLEYIESGQYKYLTLPYKVTIGEDLEPGDVVVIRAIVGKERYGDNVAPQNVEEGGCLDIVFQVVEPEKPALPITLAQITDQDKLLFGLEGNITTFSAPYATAIPEGVTAYYAEPVEWNGTDVISLESLKESVVPANFGVILVGNTATVTMEPTDVNVDTPENVFSHSAAGSVELGENCYVLANGKDGKGLYLAKTGLELPANKAYLQLSTPSSTSAFRFVIGETTAIQSVATENAKVSIYDLSGRRVFNTAKGGVYIKNGKKFIVK